MVHILSSSIRLLYHLFCLFQVHAAKDFVFLLVDKRVNAALFFNHPLFFGRNERIPRVKLHCAACFFAIAGYIILCFF